MTAPTLADAWDEFQADNLPGIQPAEACARARRAFMAGAAAVLGMARRPDGIDAARAEVLLYGRTVGTEVERAR